MSDALTIDYLKQWEDHGAMWRVVEVTKEHAVVDLCTCSGEAVDQLETDDAAVIEFVRARRRS